MRIVVSCFHCACVPSLAFFFKFPRIPYHEVVQTRFCGQHWPFDNEIVMAGLEHLKMENAIVGNSGPFDNEIVMAGLEGFTRET